ncbi:MAG: 50S ribosome-binding GTPase, partial [Phycisphaerae bacterium]|nr:50S ribosome-binding GTPase [Phycisphaerae bacterium]
ITGGGGVAGIGTRGPGEMQIEIDRRLAQAKTVALRRRLEEIQDRKRRMVAQRNLDWFTVGIVGYTNAGKSTLFNALTAGGAYADDRVFATLTTRTREWDVRGGLRVLLSDTVGFVRDLPHHLIASFKATLEEATHANLLLIVLDVSDPAARLQYETVNATLDELFEEIRRTEQTRSRARGVVPTAGWTPPPRVVLLNKVDRLPDNAALLEWQQRVPGSIAISARDPEGPGYEALRALVREAAQGGEREMTLTVPLSEAKTIHVLENRGVVLDRRYTGDSVRLRVRIGARQIAQLRAMGAKLTAE